jgi:hypothetical protein
MPLFLSPMEPQDFDAVIAHADIYPPGVDLVPPLFTLSWPVRTTQEAKERLQFTMASERRRFLGDPSAYYLKVVSAPSLEASTDPEQADVISIAHWHYYPEGFNFETMMKWEKCTFPAGLESWPDGLNRDLHDGFLLARNKDRLERIGSGTPCWVLMGLITRVDQRRRGAARMILNWAIERSERTGALAYLDTSLQSRVIYEDFGFEMVGEPREVDLRQWGGPMEISIANMVRWPKRLEKNEAKARDE